MKITIILIALLGLLTCQKNPCFQGEKEKYFDPKDLARLSLENIDNFWQNDVPTSFSNNFDHYSEYVGGIAFMYNEKRMGVAVFESRQKAIACMEGRINTVANVIKSGVPNEILKEKWWYADNMNGYVFANQWNTIIEVSIIPSEYEEVITLLMETAADIAGRVDSLSK